MKNWKFYLISFSVLLLDQLSKAIVRTFMNGKEISVIGNFFRLSHLQNPGAAFSLSFGGQSFNRIVFSIITILAIFLIVFLMRRTEENWLKCCYSLVIGGAMGNLIDRIAFGSVTDFLDFDFPDFIMSRWPVFNIADSAIVIAVILLVVYMIFIEKKTHSDSSEDL